MSTPFGAQRPCCCTALCPPPSGPASLLIHYFVSTPSGPSVLAGTPLCVHPFRGSAFLLSHRFVSTPFRANVLADDMPPRVHPLLGLVSLLAHRFVSTPFWDQCPCYRTALCPPLQGPTSLLIHCFVSTLFRANVLTSTPPRVYPIRDSAFSLAHRLVSSSDTIYNSPIQTHYFGLSIFRLLNVSKTSREHKRLQIQNQH